MKENNASEWQAHRLALARSDSLTTGGAATMILLLGHDLEEDALSNAYPGRGL